MKKGIVYVWDIWNGCYVGGGRYEGGSSDNISFIIDLNGNNWTERKIKNYINFLLGFYEDVWMYKYEITDGEGGPTIERGEFNNTPYKFPSKSESSEFKDYEVLEENPEGDYYIRDDWEIDDFWED